LEWGFPWAEVTFPGAALKVFSANAGCGRLDAGGLMLVAGCWLLDAGSKEWLAASVVIGGF
jgi:hypothetical protein